MHRITHIDTNKGILTLGMLVAHAFIFLGNNNLYTHYYNLTAGLISFSGFLFCFGYSSYIAYLSKENLPKRAMLYNAFKLLLAFYISGCAYTYIILKSTEPGVFWNIMLLNTIPGFSEFLIAFALIMVLSALFGKQLNAIIANEQWLSIAIAVCLSFTVIKFSTKTVQLGLLLGKTTCPTYPVVQYFPLFLMGGYFARQRILVSNYFSYYTLIFLTVFFLCCFLNKVPTRSPPSALWILCSFAGVYLYYSLAIYVDKVIILNTFLSNIGKNVLFWLLSSNVFIFFLTLKLNRNTCSVEKTLLICLILTFVIYYLSTIIQGKSKSA
jgi:hypothetical protein